MWWSKATLAPVLAICAVLAAGPVGCGFQPLYAQGGAQADGVDLSAVRIAGIENRLGQQLRNALVEQFSPQGEPAQPRYLLLVTLQQTESSLGYRKDSFATLGSMQVRALYQLMDGDKVVASDYSSTTASFNYLGPRYASIAMERDAEERVVAQLAQDIRHRVALFLSGRTRR